VASILTDPTLDHPASKAVANEALWLPLRERLLADIVARLKVRHVPLISGVLPAVDAQAHLGRWREAAEEVLTEVADRRCAAEWLWHTRRVEGLFEFNRLSTTAQYCRRLMEIACAGSSAAPPTSLRSTYPVTDRVIRDLLLLQESVGLVYELHGAYRWAGKDAPVQFNGPKPPTPLPEGDLDWAVREYDRLNAQTPSGALAMAGSAEFVALKGLPTSEDPILPIWFELPERTQLPVPSQTAEEYVIEAAHVIGPFRPTKLGALADHTPEQLEAIWTSINPSLVLLHLSWLHQDAWTRPDGSPTAGLINTMKIGYEVCDRQLLRDRLAWALAVASTNAPFLPESVIPATVEEATAQVVGIDRILWPPAGGGVILDLGDSVLIDWDTSSNVLLGGVRRIEQGGSVANAWAFAFEREVQALIDSSSWQPSAQVRDLVGRTARLNGEPITDLDAIGENGGRLLLVSCMSVAGSDGYLRGDFNAVRNLRTAVESKVAEWDDRLDQLRRAPVGDNYDLAGYEIVGAVVVPFRPFLLRPLLERASLDGLPVVVPVAELSDRLSQLGA
jgi:hypothetical protein